MMKSVKHVNTNMYMRRKRKIKVGLTGMTADIVSYLDDM